MAIHILCVYSYWTPAAECKLLIAQNLSTEVRNDFFPAHGRVKNHAYSIFVALVHGALKSVVLLRLLRCLDGMESDVPTFIVEGVPKHIVYGFCTVGSHVNSVIVVGEIKMEELISQNWDAERAGVRMSC